MGLAKVQIQRALDALDFLDISEMCFFMELRLKYSLTAHSWLHKEHGAGGVCDSGAARAPWQRFAFKAAFEWLLKVKLMGGLLRWYTWTHTEKHMSASPKLHCMSFVVCNLP